MLHYPGKQPPASHADCVSGVKQPRWSSDRHLPGLCVSTTVASPNERHPSLLSIAVINTRIKSNFQKIVYLSLHFQITFHHHWGHSGHNLKAGIGKQNVEHGGKTSSWRMLLTGLLLRARSACYLKQPWTICPVIAAPPVGWVFSHHSLMKSIAHRPIWWRHRLSWDSSFPDDLYQINIKTSQHTNLRRYKNIAETVANMLYV